MNDEYGSDFITMTDDEGNEFELEHLDTLEYNGTTYMAFISADAEDNADEDEDDGLIILKTVTENGEELLSTLDSEEELDTVYEMFMKRVLDPDDED